jgi:putative glutamine amidotransferase
MRNVGTWIRPKDQKWFSRAFAPHPEVRLWNALEVTVVLEEMDGLLLSGGADIAPEYLRQPVPDSSILEKEPDPTRDQWEFEAVKQALELRLPILAICKGMQLFNVALGGTLFLDIGEHNDPEMRDQNIQPLRFDRRATHRFEQVNSSHHQAVEKLGNDLLVEAWCSTDDIIEQMRLRDYPFALAVQYHPERHEMYAPLFADFVAQLGGRRS